MVNKLTLPSKENDVQIKINEIIDNLGGVNIDETTITLNSDDEIQASALIDQNTGVAKIWTGTLAQYNAITTKDSDTLYNITDDNTADAYQAYTKNEVDTGFVNVDASNLSANGKKVFDGQWVRSHLLIIGSTSIAVGTYTADLSAYLPNDTYNYEVIINAVLGGTSANTLAFISDFFGVEDSTSSSYTQLYNSTAGENRRVSNNFIIPIGINRTFTYTLNTNDANYLYIGAFAYRRIGKNS